ncbi:MAG: hypothetical protein FWD17_03090, partial [Polyangiaceae bacterium]|nr:hypothetical protein [Polyangiaceae bacterium]
MSTADTHMVSPSPAPASERATFHPAHLAVLLLVALVAGVAASFAGGAVPVIAAAVVGALVPQERGFRVRAPLAVMAGLLALFVVRFLPESAAAIEAAPASEGGHLLSWIVWLPIGGAVAVLFFPRQWHGGLRALTMTVMLVSLAVGLPLLTVSMGRGYHFNEVVPWIPRFGIRYHLAIDGISLWLVMLTLFITPIAAYASFGSIQMRLKDWCFALLLLEGGMLGALVSLDLFLFYVFWEVMLVPMYVMIGVWGGTGRIRSAVKFFLYTMFGSVLMLGAVLYVAYAYAQASGGHP